MRYQPSQHIKRQILRSILEGRYAPRQALPTIHQLAQTFNVSTKTVQKAIHALSKEGVIEAKRGVGTFIKALDWKGGKGRRVGLLHSNEPQYIKQQPYPGRVVEVLKRRLKKAGYMLVPCSLAKYDRLTLLESLGKERLCGLVLFEVDNDVLISEIRELRLPMVSLDYDAYRHGISSVVFDNIHGAFQATKHLLARGHRKIVFMRPLLRSPVNQQSQCLDAVEDERMKGYRLAMQDAGLTPRVEEYENSASEIKDVLLGLFGRRPAPSALVCVGDWSALGIIQEVKRLGFRVPEDLSIVGFGGAKKNGDFAPRQQLTTVRVDSQGMGKVAADLLLAALNGGGPRPERTILPTRLVAKDSVAQCTSKR